MRASASVQYYSILLLLISYFGMPVTAVAQAYPDKPVRMLVAFPPAGGTDLIARLIAQKLTERWGQSVLVDNKPGGAGVIASRAAATARPDGYTLYFASSDHIILGPNLYSNLPYNTAKDFAPIVGVAKQNLVLVVHPSLPAQSVKEFIGLVKSKPGALNFSSAGTGSSTHLAGELFQTIANVKLTHIPFKGSAPAITDLIAGQDISVSFAAVAPIIPHIKARTVKALAVTSADRLPALPNVPTMTEAGIPDFSVFYWFGLFAPSGTPPEIIAEINKQVVSILQMPDVIDRVVALGGEPTGGTPTELTSLIKIELPRWERIIREAGIAKTPL